MRWREATQIRPLRKLPARGDPTDIRLWLSPSPITQTRTGRSPLPRAPESRSSAAGKERSASESAALSVASNSPGRIEPDRDGRRAGVGLEAVLQTRAARSRPANARLTRICERSRASRSRDPLERRDLLHGQLAGAPPDSRTVPVTRTGRSVADPGSRPLVEAREDGDRHAARRVLEDRP